MPGAEAVSFEELYQFLKFAGVVGVLAFALLSFMQGKILPTSVVERILEESRMQTDLLADKICKEMSTGVEQAVRKGVVEAVLYLKNGGPPDDTSE